MSNFAIDALLWIVALLIVVPWLLLAAIPFVVLPFALGGVALAPVLAAGAVWEAMRQRRKERPRTLRAPEPQPALRVFVAPGIAASPERLEAVLRGFDPRIGDGVRACACMLAQGARTMLTVKILEPEGCVCRRVAGDTPGEALERLSEALDEPRPGHSGWRRRARALARECCPNVAACPGRAAVAMAG